MKVETTHPITGIKKVIEMTPDEYRANKILNPMIRIVEDDNPRGFKDESGARRYTMTLEQLTDLYRNLEQFVADCTETEYKENKESITAVYTLLHTHIKAEYNRKK